MLAALSAVALALFAAPAAPAEGCGATYTVRQGDTLTAIASRCGTTVEALLGANPGISHPGSISIGDKLSVPGGETTSKIAEDWARERDARAAPVLATGRYTVEAGDSMASIATALGVPLVELVAANEGVNPFMLQPGQELVLPGGDEGEHAEEAGEENAAAAEDGADTETTGAEPGPESQPLKVVLEGRVQKGVECPVLRTDDGETYSLVSQDYGFTPGDYVTIEGEAVEMSLCMHGRTIRVTSMTAKPAPQGG
jgi:LysM repeat protein